MNGRAWDRVRAVLHAHESLTAEPGARAVGQEALAAFAEIERDVEQMVQELNSYIQVERELRNALEDGDSGAEMGRR